MRRVLVMSVVVFIAACGGGVRSDAKPETSAQRAIPTDSASATLVQALIQKYGADAVDTCLAAWQDLRDGYEPGPVGKPGAGFRRFISECVGAPVPADMRNGTGGAREESAGSMRIESTGGFRSQSTELRTQSAGDLRAAFDR